MTANGVHPLVAQARQAFAARFGRPPRFGAGAPGRVNLIGEHTDYNDGFVMPLAIDRYTVIVAAIASDNRSSIFARDLDRVETVDLTALLTAIPGSFANYVLAVVEQFQKRGVPIANLDLLITGNLPRGSGLSSSASLEVAVATLLEQVHAAALPPLPPLDKALLCQVAEQQFVGVPCGIMDMFIISVAQPDTAMLIDCRSLQHELVPFPTPDEAALLIFDTGVERSLRSGEYAKRRQVCAAAAQRLGVPSLRDANIAQVIESPALDDDERRKALHVVSENARVLDAAAALRAGDFARLGELMFQSHGSLRDLYDVSIDELNLLVDLAHAARDRNGDVWGARLTGAGFGGCAIVLCRPEARQRVAAELSEKFTDRFGRAPGVFPAKAVAGAQSVHLV